MDRAVSGGRDFGPGLGPATTRAFFKRTWIAFRTPRAALAMGFRSPIVSKRSIAHSKCWSASSRSSLL